MRWCRYTPVPTSESHHLLQQPHTKTIVSQWTHQLTDLNPCLSCVTYSACALHNTWFIYFDVKYCEKCWRWRSLESLLLVYYSWQTSRIQHWPHLFYKEELYDQNLQTLHTYSAHLKQKLILFLICCYSSVLKDTGHVSPMLITTDVLVTKRKIQNSRKELSPECLCWQLLELGWPVRETEGRGTQGWDFQLW